MDWSQPVLVALAMGVALALAYLMLESAFVALDRMDRGFRA